MRVPVRFRVWPGRWAVCVLAALSLSACGGGGGGGSMSSTSYTIGGSVSGLSVAGLVLSDNGGDNLTLSSGATTFTFSQSVPADGNYSVAVATQPTGETCTVSSGSGMATGDVTSVGVACTVNTYTIGGNVSGLAASGLVLADNGGDDLPVALGASTFTFTQALKAGAAYDVTVATQPSGQTCTVTSGAGTANAKVTNVSVACAENLYTVGGSISGLTQSGLVLQLNGQYDDAIAANASAFTFANTLASGASYSVTVHTPPTNESCTVAGGSGTVSGDVATVKVTCAVLTYTMSGTITGPASVGLSGGLVLQEYSGHTLSIPAGATSYDFSTPVAAGTSVDVTALVQPSWQNCTPGTTNFSGPLESNITTDTFSCISVTPTGSAATTGTTFTLPDGIAIDSAGDVFVADSGNNRIVEIAANGTVTTPLTTASAPGLSGPMGVAVNAAGTIIYVANTGGNDVIEDNNGVVSTLATGFSSPDGIAVDGNGNVFLADTGHSQIDEISPTGTVTRLASTYAFNQPSGVAVDSAGNVFVADTGNDAVEEISGTQVTALAGSTSGAYSHPFGVAVDSSGNVYVADANYFEVQMITPSGGVAVVAGSKSGQGSCTANPVLFHTPYGVAWNSNNGDLYVSDYPVSAVCQLKP